LLRLRVASPEGAVYAGGIVAEIKSTGFRNPIIAALDVPSAEQALKLAELIAPAVGAFKIGGELFTAAGPDIVRRVRATGAAVFLDLKFHDIPNTVAKAVASAIRLDVQMLTIHTSGGGEMMRAAEKSAVDTAKQLGLALPLVLGVTVLTSSDAGTLARAGVLAAGTGGVAADFAGIHSTGDPGHSHRGGKGG